MRDKLIELIGDALVWDVMTIHEAAQKIADRLIFHGVTFAEDNNVPCKWIPVSERLPTERGRYWAWCKFYIRERKVERPYVRYFSPELNAFTLDGGRDGEVTHWMPIEPPKEGERDVGI